VVAGDKNQLPPTTFFFYTGEEDERVEETAATIGFESLLDLMSSFLFPWSLDWHYRSKSESLIAFSNHHIYKDRLVTFPSPSSAPALSYVLAPQDHSDANEDSSGPEVEEVVRRVLGHASKMLSRPEDQRETLGVIAMGIKHARRLEFALDEALRSRPDLDTYSDLEHPERFFIKNLERVQGDERDAIIISVGYGKDRAGKLPYRFGPLLLEGGERRLNVAITRARRRLTLVSSFSHHDMDPSRSNRRGVELLRLYLQFAASNGRLLGDRADTGAPMNPFEEDIMLALREREIHLLPQWGASRYRIDLVASHPRQPGRLVLAVECDGASYHSAPTARDRDRLRQQHLEALGWRFHRIWSTDWFTQREQEVNRAVRAFNDAVAFADRIDAGEPVALQAAAKPLSNAIATQEGQSRPIDRKYQGDNRSRTTRILSCAICSNGFGPTSPPDTV
jgi:very-short-patch-repair endonuclease